MIAHLIQEVLALIFGLIRNIVEIFIQALRSPETWLILAFIGLTFGSALAFLSPDLSFLGVPGLVHFSDVQTVGADRILFALMYQLLLFVLSLWWLWVFALLFEPTRQLWIHWRQEMFKESIKWVQWELRMPRLVTQTPEAMDQVFTALHALRNGAGNLNEIYIDGELTRWFTIEIVSIGGDVRFFLRGFAKQKNLVETAFFSYYPDVEIAQVKEDYMDKLPKTVGEIYNAGNEIFGGELILAKSDAYPIKTYPKFETPDPERRLDPISAILELMGKVKPGEFMGIQMQLQPAPKDWYKDYADVVKKLKKPEDDKMDEKTGKFSFNVRTPGETEVLEAVEKNLSKPAFNTIIRLLYISPKETFVDAFARQGIAAAFNQYALYDLNSFKANEGMATRAQLWDYPHVFSGIRTEYKKQRIFDLWRRREIPAEMYWGKWYLSSIYNSGFHTKFSRLNTEALATVFHPPTEFVLTAPHIKRVESRKAGAPAGLAIFADESAVEKFYPDKK